MQFGALHGLHVPPRRHFGAGGAHRLGLSLPRSDLHVRCPPCQGLHAVEHPMLRGRPLPRGPGRDLLAELAQRRPGAKVGVRHRHSVVRRVERHRRDADDPGLRRQPGAVRGQRPQQVVHGGLCGAVADHHRRGGDGRGRAGQEQQAARSHPLRGHLRGHEGGKDRRAEHAVRAAQRIGRRDGAKGEAAAHVEHGVELRRGRQHLLHLAEDVPPLQLCRPQHLTAAHDNRVVRV
mmetsp:Transcript_68788/g.201904  ORF Transcript_68788/g.201904 Transcript_68788/m.201904 type:complete len:234 (-) Transcript_68788:193-894(-)